MKRLLCLLALLPALAFGQTKISQLPTVSSAKGTDVVPAYQSGSCSATGGTCGETLAQFTAYGFGLLSGDCTINVSTNVITCTKINGLTWPSLVSGDCLTNNGTTLSWGSCGSGSGTVTSFSFTNGGGINGSVATATTTPALSLTPSFTGLSYATSGTGFAAATSGNIIGLWTGTCSSSTYLNGSGACATPSGSGTVNSALQYSLPYYSASGTASTLSGLNSPTSGPGYFTLRFDPTSGTAVAPTADQVGANVRSINGATSTDTVLYSDVLGLVVHDKAGSSSVNETLPTPTTLTNSHFAYNYCNNSSNTDTITPTTWTIAVNGGSAGSSISIGSGVCAQITVDPFNSSQWDAFSFGASSGGGSPSTPAFSVQYDNAGAFGGVSLTAGTLLQGTGTGAAPTATTTPTLGVAGTTAGTLGFASTSGGVSTVVAGTNSANETFTLPGNAGGTFALANITTTISGLYTFSAGIISSKNGSASTSPISVTGSIFTGGTGTTTVPYDLFQPSAATAVTTWSTAGTFHGDNAASGFTGNFFDEHVNGGSSVFSVNYQGNVLAGTYNGTTIPASATLTQTIASGTATLGTSAIASGACATVVTVAATGVATTDVVSVGFNSDPTAVTGYGASATGAVLTIYPYPTSGDVNFRVCNSTSASITPGALTLNWRVTR